MTFIARQWAEVELQSKCVGTEKGLGICTQGLRQTSSNSKHRKNRGRRTNNEALQELGQMLLNLGKMKALKAFSLTS